MKRKPKIYQVPHIESLQDMLIQSAARHGEKLALEDLKETPIPKMTYNSLLRTVLKFGTALHELGLPERSHIAVLSENRVQWAISYLTSMCFNYVVVPIDAKLTTNEILNIIHESDTNAIVFSESFDSMLREERCARVRSILAALKPRDAELLLLRADDMAYRDLATIVGVQPTSVGSLLARAEAEFERKYRARYGEVV